MKKTTFAALALTAGVLLSSNTSFAADIEAAPYDWTGFYAGLTAGYGFGHSDYRLVGAGLDNDKYNINGFLGGGQVGYNFQINQIVFGPEISFWGSDVHGRKTNTVQSPGAIARTNVNWLGMFNGRVGVAQDRWLGYVTGGYTLSEVDFRYSLGAQAIADPHKTHNGWNIGAGIEHAWTDNLIFGLEYRYIDLGKERHQGLNNFAAPVAPRDHHVDANIHTIMLRASWKF